MSRSGFHGSSFGFHGMGHHGSSGEPRPKRTFRQRVDEWGLVLRQTPRVAGMTWRAWPVGAILLPVLTVLGGPLPALSLYFLKKVVDGLQLWMTGHAAAGRPLVFLYVSLGFAAVFVQRGLDLLTQFFQTVLEARLRFYIQTRIMSRSILLDMTFYEMPSFYDKLQRAQREVGFRPFSIILSLVRGVRDTITLAGYIAVITTLAWWLLPYLVLTSLPALWVQMKFGRKGWALIFGRTPTERQMGYLYGLLTSNREIKEVRLFGLGEYLASRWKDLFWQCYKQDIRLAERRRLSEFGAMGLGTLAYAGFYVYVIYCMLTRAGVTIGSFIMYTQAMERATGTVGSIMSAIASFYENSLYLSNLFEFLVQEPQIVAPPSPKPVPSPIRKGLAFENVTFRYPGATEDALRGVTLEIPAGRRVAFVGENGAGKTTLIKLIARLYDPQSGRITVDGIDLRQMDPDAWQRQIGIIFQDFARYAVTARENVGFGNLERLNDLEAIRQAAELSGALECVERLDKNWETILGKMFDDGQELSLGEWQRVALARAFLRDSPLLVLDEPTASLDAKQEYEIFQRFNELTQGKTTILISHRFSSVRMAERIFVMEHGRVLESGSHDELLALNNRYADLFNRQASAYR